MVYRIFGRAGSGKTEYMINCLKETQSTGVDCLFLVPEQQSIDTEELLEAKGAAQLDTEVLNFERLPNRVFREIGGLGKRNVDGAGKCALIAAAINALSDTLKLYSTPCRGTLSELSATISALKRLNISAKAFEDICNGIAKSAEAGFAAKLKETALIYGEYQRLLGEALEDDDDPLTSLAKNNDTASFFADKAVFIDGIYTFTPQQYEIIKLMAENAAALYISFTADEDSMFDGTASCARKIKEYANGKTEDVFLQTNHRAKTEELLYGEEQLWTAGAPYAELTENVRFAKCETVYEESLYAASCIYALKNEGYRYNDIAIACRHPESYAGVLDSVLASYDIPFYFAVKDSAATKPLSAFVLSILEMAEKNFPLYAVKKYLKSTFSVLTEAQADAIIRYAEAWNIRGKAWIKEADWLMNPEGYAESFSPEAESRLRYINQSRLMLAHSLSAVTEALQSPNLTVGEGVKLLYSHMVDCGVPEKLSAAADGLSKAGDEDNAVKTAALWGLTVDIFDRLYSLSGDMKATSAKLRAMIEAMLESSSLGAIPSYTDAVNIGDARLMRATGAKVMLLLGVNDGVFPSMPEKSGVFTAREGAVLEKHGVELLPSVEKAVEEERFFFYNCASAPSHRLYISYIYGNGGKPSPLYKGLLALFPKAPRRCFGEDERDYMFCRKAALDRLPYIKNAALKEKLKAELCKDKETKALLQDFPPIQDESAYIRESTLQLLTLSYSKIDCYNNCGMNYLFRYILRLKDDRRLGFSAIDSGKYMHRIMELYVQKRMETGKYVPADKNETEAEINAITEQYINQIMPEKPSKRLEKLIGRLKNAALFVCDSINNEFSCSGFVPIGFEVKIGTGGVAAPLLTTQKGRKVTTVGYIDRLDSALINGKRYIRVADYKSSTHSFNSREVENGEKMQMLSYLFSYCDAAEDGAVPAGVLYRSFTLPDGEEYGSQTGLVLDEPYVRSAMDSTGVHIKKAEKASTERIEQLKEQVYCHIKETADLISDGVMNAKVFKKKEQNCAFCPFGEICRNEKPKKRF